MNAVVGEDLLRGAVTLLGASLMKPWKFVEQCSPAKWQLPCLTPS